MSPLSRYKLFNYEILLIFSEQFNKMWSFYTMDFHSYPLVRQKLSKNYLTHLTWLWTNSRQNSLRNWIFFWLVVEAHFIYLQQIMKMWKDDIYNKIQQHLVPTTIFSIT